MQKDIWNPDSDEPLMLSDAFIVKNKDTGETFSIATVNPDGSVGNTKLTKKDDSPAKTEAFESVVNIELTIENQTKKIGGGSQSIRAKREKGWEKNGRHPFTIKLRKDQVYNIRLALQASPGVKIDTVEDCYMENQKLQLKPSTNPPNNSFTVFATWSVPSNVEITADLHRHLMPVQFNFRISKGQHSKQVAINDVVQAKIYQGQVPNLFAGEELLALVFSCSGKTQKSLGIVNYCVKEI